MLQKCLLRGTPVPLSSTKSYATRLSTVNAFAEMRLRSATRARNFLGSFTVMRALAAWMTPLSAFACVGSSDSAHASWW